MANKLWQYSLYSTKRRVGGQLFESAVFELLCWDFKVSLGREGSLQRKWYMKELQKPTPP